MNKSFKTFLVAKFVVILFFLIPLLFPNNISRSQIYTQERPFEKKDKVEQIFYQLNCKGIKIGKATMVLYPEIDLEGRSVVLITFETDTMFFDDLEKVYIEKENCLPIRVERNISQFGKHFFIREVYNQEELTVNIHKEGEKVISIRKSENIQNPISMIYYVRTLKHFKKGKTIPVIFPLFEIKTNFENIEEIRVPAGKFNTFLFKSSPDKFNFWLSNDEHRLPLKLEVPGALGYSALMTEIRYVPYDKFIQQSLEGKRELKSIWAIPKIVKNVYEAIRDEIRSAFRFKSRKN